MSMFCYQCEQTAHGSGCTVQGVCGKTETTAQLQDALIEVTKGLAQYAHRAAQLGARDAAIDRLMIRSLFATVTNVDFDDERIITHIREAAVARDQAKALYHRAAADAGTPVADPAGPAQWQPAADRAALISQATDLDIARLIDRRGPTAVGLEYMVLFGLKGAAAYADHALVLGYEDDSIYAAFHALLDRIAGGDQDVQGLLGAALEVGALNLKVMELLDRANTKTYGTPVPTQVRVTPVAGKCILVSGHDLRDLKLLLEQTEGTGINIYTHGEMLPCHAYPELKKHAHLVGNFGGAWQDQQKEFKQFPGSFLFTTNCIQKPADTYKDRVFTTGLVAWPGVGHIGEDKNFTPLIDAALAAPGFSDDAPAQEITVGFGHGTVLGVAQTVIDAVKSGAIRHFFLIGGCDGAKSGRNYYTEFAEQVPDDCLILTLACGKYRFNKRDFGTIGGLPRLLDMGQCNDAYSAIKVAGALAEAFGCGLNDLPLSLILSWYEQKAVAILLTLLHLGIKNIRLGPSLPAFVTPEVLQVLVDTFAIASISTPQEDLKTILG